MLLLRWNSNGLKYFLRSVKCVDLNVVSILLFLTDKKTIITSRSFQIWITLLSRKFKKLIHIEWFMSQYHLFLKGITTDMWCIMYWNWLTSFLCKKDIYYYFRVISDTWLSPCEYCLPGVPIVLFDRSSRHRQGMSLPYSLHQASCKQNWNHEKN